ncbi:MAG: PA2779 family protein [Desulfobacterales bacterium]|jgi:hypothetical protein
MKTFSTFFKPTSIFLTIVLLLMSTFYQSASAAMIRTETLLEPDRRLQTRDDLQQLLARKDVQEALIAWGINPLEAKARINSFSDTEIEQIAEKINQLPVGGGFANFAIVVVLVIVIAFIIFEYTGVTNIFP